MYNTINLIATNRMFNVERFTAFVEANHAQHIVEGSLSNWHLDDIVKDYVAKTDRDIIKDDRDAATAELRKKYGY